MKRITKRLLSILTVIAMIIWVFPVFSLADSGDASYVLTGLNYTANGIFKNNDPAGYWISGTNSEEIWKDGAAPPKSLISAFSTRLATSTSFSTALKDDPVTGKSYYFKITIRNEIAENHAVDFSQLTAENCRLDITGYGAECYKVRTFVDSQKRDSVELDFKITKGFYTSNAIHLSEGGESANILGQQLSSVYFGTYPQSRTGASYSIDPIKWLVLENADGRLFLLSDSNLDVMKFHEDKESVTWETSTIRSWLNGYGASANIGGQYGIDYTDDSFFGTAFDPRERADIVNTVLVNESYAEWGGVSTTDKVFLLRESQATKKEYGFAQSNTYNDSRKSYNTAYVADGGKTGSTKMSGENWYDRWWLRTPGVITSKESAALYVDGSGGIIDWYDRSLNTADVRDASIAVRPALNLSLDSVLLSSAAEGGKVSGASGAYALAKTGTFIGGAWKLTLLDHAHSSFTVVSSGRTGNEVTASYTGAVTGPNEYISALIKDSEGSVTYYGRIAWASSMSGSVTINVGGKLNSGDTLYLFNEQYNGDRRTDYASPLNELKSIEVLSGALSYKSPAYIGLEVKAIRDGKLNSIYYSVPAGSFRYQWQISPDGASDWTDIEGATTDTYTPKAAEGGKYIRVFAEADGYEGRVYGAALQVEYKMHTVTFDSHGGTAVPSQDLRHGEKAVRPADPTRAGWVFDDWYKNETYTAKFNFDAPVTDDMRAFARWLPPSYTVSFDTDGGSAVASQSVTEGKKVTKPADPTKAGYSFVGWYSNARKTIAFDFDGTPIEANTTIYAKWADLSAKQYNVFFRKDSRTLDNIKVTHGLTVDRPDADRVTFLENIAGGGAVLEGWYADAALTVPFDFENTPITETTSIYGKWLTGHEVFFDTMAGNPTSIYRNVADGQTVKRPADPEKSGYVFDGWYTDWACTDAYDFSSPVNEDIKLYAKWHKHTLTQIEAKEATCKDSGIIAHWVCEECGRIYLDENASKELTAEDVTTAPLGHTPGSPVVENEVAPACETKGSYDEVVYCTVCGSELSRTLQTTPAVGHDWGAPLYIWTADLGHATARSVCSHDSSHVTEETSGSFYAETNPPGCETEGIGVYTVSFVNPLFSTQASMRMIPALGHDWGEWSITTAPTPTSDGVKTRTCSRCGSTETEAVTYEEALLPFPVVSSVSALGDNVTVGYDDYSGDADGVMLFIAAYDTNGKLISFVMTAPDKSGSVTVSMKLTGVKSIKVFVLDTYNGFLPLTEAFEQPV